MKISGELLAVLSSVFIGLAVPIGVLASKEIGAFQITVYSSLASAAFLLLISIITKEKIQIIKSTKYLREIASVVTARSIIGNLILFYGFSLTTAIHSAFMLRLEPVFVVPLSYVFLKDKIKSNQVALITIMIIGALLLSTGGSISSFSQIQIGDLLIIISLLFFAYSYIPIKRIGNEINSLSITFINNLAGGAILFLIMLFLPFKIFTLNTSNVWLLLSYVILFSVLGLYLYFASLRKAKPWVVSSLLTLSAVVGTLLAFFWLGETLNSVQIAGSALILAASYFVTRN